LFKTGQELFIFVQEVWVTRENMDFIEIDMSFYHKSFPISYFCKKLYVMQLDIVEILGPGGLHIIQKFFGIILLAIAIRLFLSNTGIIIVK
jgi:small neutral amino acid transporter SnatA (MarC family)